MQTIRTFPISNGSEISMYEVIDCKTGKRVGKPYATRVAASRRADKLDLEYGAIRYNVRRVEAKQGE
ncbi:hypothetical protein BG58_11140 [Caballeronia jiangsuensis]|nr:hypothetical protein BG58_11140 [Caballeronia jiangsuensis]